MNAFRDADMAAFQTYALKQRKTDSTDTDKVMARAEAYAALNPDVVKLERPAADDMEDLLTAQAPDPTLYRLKTQPFDEVTKNLLAQLGKVLGPAHQCLTNVPLSDFVRAADGNDFNLKTRQVPYLIVARESLEIVCGLQFKDGAACRLPEGCVCRYRPPARGISGQHGHLGGRGQGGTDRGFQRAGSAGLPTLWRKYDDQNSNEG
jgi:hypothetical protein